MDPEDSQATLMGGGPRQWSEEELVATRRAFAGKRSLRDSMNDAPWTNGSSDAFFTLAERVGVEQGQRLGWIRDAAEAGDAAALGRMSKMGWIRAQDGDGEFAGDCLSGAAASRSVECVRILLDSGFDPNARAGKISKGATTGLLTAAFVADVEIVKMLLEAGADVEAGLGSRGTPLAIAQSLVGTSRRSPVCDALLDAGADWCSPGKSGKRSVLGMLWSGTFDREAALDLVRSRAMGQSVEALANARQALGEASPRDVPGQAEMREEALAMIEAAELTASVRGRSQPKTGQANSL